jgi:hypothetical protein
MVKELTEKHQQFIDALIENEGNVRKAAEALEVSAVYGYHLMKYLKQEIINRAEEILALHALKASFTLTNAVDENANAPTNPLRLRAAEQILDRIGVVKKEKMEISGNADSPLFILPAKQNDTQ